MTARCDKLVDSGRRKFLTGASVAAVGAAASAIDGAAGEGRASRAQGRSIPQIGSAMCMILRSMSH